jgi:hypothetical protein
LIVTSLLYTFIYVTPLLIITKDKMTFDDYYWNPVLASITFRFFVRLLHFRKCPRNAVISRSSTKLSSVRRIACLCYNVSRTIRRLSRLSLCLSGQQRISFQQQQQQQPSWDPERYLPSKHFASDPLGAPNAVPNKPSNLKRERRKVQHLACCDRFIKQVRSTVLVLVDIY